MTDYAHILSRFPPLADVAHTVTVAPLSGGLINDTLAVGDRWILQRLHPIFSAPVNDDIAALTPHLNAAGVPTPTLVRADDGEPCVTMDAPRSAGGGVWRVMARLPGLTLHQLANPDQARSAGALVGRFHSALLPVTHTFAFTRPGAHDTDAHMATLERALTDYPEHRLRADVGALAKEIFALWTAHEGAPNLPLRIGHGDLKVSNLLFRRDATGVLRADSVLDLDTMAWMPMDVELGDALRSWCNRGREDGASASLDQDIFAGALAGYAEHAGTWMTAEERRGITSGLLRICVELSARFAADALRERYFGWDAAVAPTRGEHNLIRARNQLDLARQVARARPALDQRVATIFGR